MIDREREAKGLEERVAEKIVRAKWVFKALAFFILSFFYAAVYYWMHRLSNGTSLSTSVCLVFGFVFMAVLALFDLTRNKLKSRRSPK